MKGRLISFDFESSEMIPIPNRFALEFSQNTGNTTKFYQNIVDNNNSLSKYHWDDCICAIPEPADKDRGTINRCAPRVRKKSLKQFVTVRRVKTEGVFVYDIQFNLAAMKEAMNRICII